MRENLSPTWGIIYFTKVDFLLKGLPWFWPQQFFSISHSFSLKLCHRPRGSELEMIRGCPTTMKIGNLYIKGTFFYSCPGEKKVSVGKKK